MEEKLTVRYPIDAESSPIFLRTFIHQKLEPDTSAPLIDWCLVEEPLGYEQI